MYPLCLIVTSIPYLNPRRLGLGLESPNDNALENSSVVFSLISAATAEFLLNILLTSS